MRKKYIVMLLSAIFVLLLSLAAAPSTCAASKSQEGIERSAPTFCLISSQEELTAWHDFSSNPNELGKLDSDVIISETVTLSETAVLKDLGAIGHVIRVDDSGHLILDNSKLAVQGPGTLIVVEAGGCLSLKTGAAYTAPDVAAIIVKKGGTILTSPTFLIDGGVVQDENESDEIQPEPEPEPEPDPKPEPEPDPDPEPTPDPEPQPPINAVSPITGIVGDDFSLTCLEGDAPETHQYPAAVRVVYALTKNTYAQADIPVRWELDTVDFNHAGTYTVKGIFSDESLAKHQLSNPDNITATLKLLVQKSGPIKTMTGNVIRVESDGLCLIRLMLPVLPADTEALYVYRSRDKKNWEKCTGRDAQTVYDDFLPFVQTEGTVTYVNYRYKTDYQPIWFRVQVADSIYQGVSNPFYIEIPSSARPGESTATGEKGDDGSSEGNRGGGGQNESDRNLPDTSDTEDESKQNQGTETSGAVLDKSSQAVPQKIGSLSPEVSGGDKNEAAVLSSSDSGKTDTAGADIPEKETVKPETKDTAEDDSPAASVQKKQNKTIQMSRGILLTALITVLAAGGLLLLKKYNRNQKKKS